ncbi:hypothetical protein [Terrabacter terrigena]|uniref:Uncharacterized protein n=1 Tax=Terrabacter terrigena TaxID=574718 RepID=A0ABW3MZP2_9MICO
MTALPAPALPTPPALPVLPARPFPGAAHPTRLVDAPTDHRRRFGFGEGRRVHRFPAATFLDRPVAREELAVACDALEASDRAASRRLAALGTLAALLLGTLVVLIATGHGTGPGLTGTSALWGAGAGLAGVVIGLVAVLRQHQREHDALTDRVHRYEARLEQLRALR